MWPALLLTVALQARAAQTPPQSRPQTPPRDRAATDAKGTAVIRGRVTSADSGKPLRRVQVRISAPAVESRTISTDRDGRYQFKELPAGRYRIDVTRSGYLALSYGQRRQNEQGRPLQLADGQVAEKIDFVMPRMGLISGRIVDETGEPISGVMVFAMQSRWFEGRRRLAIAGANDRTDDVGEYKLAGLAPGEYYVHAATRETWTEGDGAEMLAYAPTYFPSTVATADAQRIRVAAGRTVTGIDFALVPGRAAKVSGTATSSRGVPLAGESVSVTQEFRGPNMSNSFGFGGGTVTTDGTFVIEKLSPGDYKLQVRKPADKDGAAEAASYPLTMNGVDVEGVVITTSPGRVLTGTISKDDGSAPPFRHAHIHVGTRSLQPDSVPRGISDPDSGRVREDWTFQVTNVFGPQMVRIGGLPDGWALRSIVYGGRDVTDNPIDADPSQQEITGVHIFLTDRITVVSGSVVDKDGKVAPEGSVVIFSADDTHWGEDSRRVRTVRVDQSATFEAKGLPPGEYLAASLDYVADGDSNDPEYLEKLRPNATRLTLEEGEMKQIALTLRK